MSQSENAVEIEIVRFLVPIFDLDRKSMACWAHFWIGFFGGSVSHGTRPAIDRWLWFTGHHASPYCDATTKYAYYFSAAVMSWRAYARDVLVPVHIFHGTHGTLPLGDWLERQGGIPVYYPTLSFEHEMLTTNSQLRDQCVLGTYARLDVHILVASRALAIKNHASQKYVLYTDSDMIFLTRLTANCIRESLPDNGEVWSYAHESTRRGPPHNAGVLFQNLDGYAATHLKLMAFARARRWDLRHAAHDQGMLNYFTHTHNGSAKLLPDVWNWKVYWGNPPAKSFVLVHFHGMKPLTRACDGCNITWLECMGMLRPNTDSSLTECPVELGGTGNPNAASPRNLMRLYAVWKRRDRHGAFVRHVTTKFQSFVDDAAYEGTELATYFT